MPTFEFQSKKELDIGPPPGFEHLTFNEKNLADQKSDDLWLIDFGLEHESYSSLQQSDDGSTITEKKQDEFSDLLYTTDRIHGEGSKCGIEDVLKEIFKLPTSSSSKLDVLSQKTENSSEEKLKADFAVNNTTIYAELINETDDIDGDVQIVPSDDEAPLSEFEEEDCGFVILRQVPSDISSPSQEVASRTNGYQKRSPQFSDFNLNVSGSSYRKYGPRTANKRGRGIKMSPNARVGHFESGSNQSPTARESEKLEYTGFIFRKHKDDFVVYSPIHDLTYTSREGFGGQWTYLGKDIIFARDIAGDLDIGDWIKFSTRLSGSLNYVSNFEKTNPVHKTEVVVTKSGMQTVKISLNVFPTKYFQVVDNKEVQDLVYPTDFISCVWDNQRTIPSMIGTRAMPRQIIYMPSNADAVCDIPWKIVPISKKNLREATNVHKKTHFSHSGFETNTCSW